ncbi:MAG: hypothetical protein IH800_15215, partial [Myxococcales bacterium]|nr:hypothetical protein [Myxococcales bacterium]
MGTLFEDLRVVQERIASLGEILNVPTASANSDGASPAGALGQQRINELSEAHEQPLVRAQGVGGDLLLHPLVKARCGSAQRLGMNRLGLETLEQHPEAFEVRLAERSGVGDTLEDRHDLVVGSGVGGRDRCLAHETRERLGVDRVQVGVEACELPADVGVGEGVAVGSSGEGGDEVVDEDDLVDGSSPNAPALTQTGTFNIAAPDGYDDLTIGGVLVVTDGVVTLPGSPIGTTYGALTITGVNLATGVVSYSYTLTDNTLDHGPGDNGENDVFDTIAVHLTDTDGDFDDSTLIIKVIDDVPTANPDTDMVDEGAGETTEGDVILGTDPDSGDEVGSQGADVSGADEGI